MGLSSRADLPLRVREDFVTDGTAGEVVNSLSQENKWTRRFFGTFGALELASALAVWACLCGQRPLLSSRHRRPTLSWGLPQPQAGNLPSSRDGFCCLPDVVPQMNNLSEPQFSQLYNRDSKVLLQESCGNRRL